MKLLNSEIINVAEPLRKLAQIKLPVRTSLAIVRLSQKLATEVDAVVKVRDTLIKRYGKPDPERRNLPGIKPGDENWSKFNEELGVLYSQEIELDIEPVTLPDTLEIEPYVLLVLDRFIKIAEPTPK